MEEHAFHPQSRVWVYTASRELVHEEVEQLNGQLEKFCAGWCAHDQKLFAGGRILHDRLVVLFVDETQAGASGCSIDTSTRFFRDAGKALDCDFFVRNLVAVNREGAWDWIDFKTIPSMLESGTLSADTLIIDTSISDLQGLKSWIKPLKDSWLKRYLKEPAL